MTLAKPRILVVEDEPALVELLIYNLEKGGYDVRVARDGEEAELAIAEEIPDLVVLDWMLPYVSGIEICRRLRRGDATRDLPIIMLTARSEEGDRIRGLEAGADDYVVKPFSPAELVARVGAILRRTQPGGHDETLSYGDVQMDTAAHRVTRSGQPVALGPTEYRLLHYFLCHPKRVFSREQLMNGVWGYDSYIEPRTVDVHIRRLRKALNTDGQADLIRTVRSAGYALE
ncbi:MAG: phosphate regulon transcriptional regulator PhoB [Alphaproteobacteria bacterium]